MKECDSERQTSQAHTYIQQKGIGKTHSQLGVVEMAESELYVVSEYINNEKGVVKHNQLK